ncbi:hypothetical protein V6R21_07720 [Limibacter armeniacum]|uniref:hypothetical protein n=1 Tax=Limibacter armeniacum TaxID=466084 RepID=UPI002FE5FB6E
MDTGAEVELQFVTGDLKRKTGGDIKTIKGVKVGMDYENATRRFEVEGLPHPVEVSVWLMLSLNGKQIIV